MADIAKCVNETCPSKNTCYRYTVQAHPMWQSYGLFQWDKNTGRCDYYCNNGREEENKIKQIEDD